ncbi:hypothetical protein LU196_00410 [Pantoea sp. Mb-10]|uniref:hypothetical protein n=1 Tax=unclassified Pantoea TaxID=2630326 RepID=UPI001E2DC733|nr:MULTISPECIES: hypothetical protein [unclassified Pantoea]MCE0488529.1 hypothetical protein [Pantoea sp. Mb-10]MCE0500276.1 hypothetical protein [Pantoea sp. Pb-8]
MSMEARDDKLIAIIGLLAACLIGVVFLFTLTWLTADRHPVEAPQDVKTCTPQASSPQHS